MKSRDFYYWNEEILLVEGEPFCKYAVVAYNREKPYVVKRLGRRTAVPGAP